MGKHERYVGHLQPYFRALADGMGLRDWVFEILDRPADKGCNAQIHCTKGRKHARVRIGKHLRKRSLDEQRQTLVHELVHCHFAATHNATESAVSEVAYQFFVESFELGVDAVADLIALSMPLPGEFVEREVTEMGKPSKGTPADKRLKANKGATKPAAKPAFKGAAMPFKKIGKK